jgi:hypothetical protein
VLALRAMIFVFLMARFAALQNIFIGPLVRLSYIIFSRKLCRNAFAASEHILILFRLLLVLGHTICSIAKRERELNGMPGQVP